MLKDDLTLFSESQAVTVTAVGSRIVDGATAGNAKLNELFFHNTRSVEFTSDDATTLTLDTILTAGDTFTLGDTVYTATADGTADAALEVDVGANVVETVANVIAAIDGTDNFNTANAYVATGTSTAVTKAVGTLTIAGVVIHGETVLVGNGTLDDVYEFLTTASQTVTTAGNIAVDISGGTTEASTGTLTLDTLVTAGDTMTIGTKIYTYVALGTADADGEIDIGAAAANSQANTVAAINGADAHNTAHTQVTAGAFGGDDSIITALIGGVIGDSIATTETFTAGTNVFDAATLGTTNAGVDATAAEAVTALVLAEAGGTAAVVMTDGAGDTVVVTADAAGVAGNLYATTETMANGSFATATLIGGDVVITLIPKIGGTGKASTETFTATNNVFSAVTLTSTTVVINLQTSATQSGTGLTALAGTITTMASSSAIPIAELNSGSEVFKLRLPEGALRYLGISFTVADGPFTAGNMDSFLSFEA